MGSSVAARGVSFRFEGDPRRVANVKAAIEHLANRDLIGSGVSGANVDVGPAYGGGVNTAIVRVGSAIVSNPAGNAAIAVVPLAGITIVMGAAGVGNSDGVGGAYVAPVAGSYVGVHLIVDVNNVTRVVLTSDGVAAAGQAALSAHVATLAANDLGSKLIGILLVGAGAALPDQTVRGDGEARVTTIMTPSGDVSAAAGTALTSIVVGAATTPLLLEAPVQTSRRKVTINYQITEAAGGAASAIADLMGVANGDGDAENSPVSQQIITENGAAIMFPLRQTVNLVTGVDGRTIQFFATSVENQMNARIIDFDYNLS